MSSTELRLKAINADLPTKAENITESAMFGALWLYPGLLFGISLEWDTYSYLLSAAGTGLLAALIPVGRNPFRRANFNKKVLNQLNVTDRKERRELRQKFKKDTYLEISHGVITPRASIADVVNRDNVYVVANGNFEKVKTPNQIEIWDRNLENVEEVYGVDDLHLVGV